MQLGIFEEKAARQAKEAGFNVFIEWYLMMELRDIS
jgi:hypothetical protein